MKDSVSEIIGCIICYMQKDRANISSLCLSEFAAKFTKQMTENFLRYYDIKCLQQMLCIYKA